MSDYEAVKKILDKALTQMTDGKGAVRHGENIPIEEQFTMKIEQNCRGFCRGQAMKKLHETARLEGDARIKELLGAINYTALAILGEKLFDKNY